MNRGIIGLFVWRVKGKSEICRRMTDDGRQATESKTGSIDSVIRSQKYSSGICDHYYLSKHHEHQPVVLIKLYNNK
jgi:hypothetical protein